MSITPVCLPLTGFYKQVTITPPGNPQKITAAPPAPSGPTMRIGGTLQPSPSSRMTVLPANAGPGGPLQTVSLAPTSAQQINVPLGAAGTKGIMAGRGIINVPHSGSGALGSNPTGIGPPGVTIQKTSIPLSSPRTLALPYGTSTQVAAIPKVRRFFFI